MGDAPARVSSPGWNGPRDSRLLAVAVGLSLFAVALAPRWLARDVYVTSDEDGWMRRAGGFAYGLSHGLPGRTYQNGHPGVLTMELAIVGQGPGGAERFADPVTGARLVTRVSGFFDGLVEARRAFALVNSALVALIGMLAWRLFGLGPAITGGLLLALDPLMIAHAQLVHTDALLAGLTCVAALCALVRWQGGGGRGWVLTSGVVSGLALLTKLPAVYLIAAHPLLALSSRRSIRQAVPDLLWWGLAGVVTFVLLWPSVWVNPFSTLTRMMAFARETGGQADEVGSFFLGRSWGDPGPLFYPVALAFRFTPLEVFGLLALCFMGWRSSQVQGKTLAALALYTLGFLLFITLAPKKFDRYALPMQPPLLLLGGVGLWLLLRQCAACLVFPGRRYVVVAALVGLGSLQLAAPMSVYPYYMTYFNPLLGGGPVAAQTVMVGNGEGMDQVADYFNRLPGVGEIWVAAHSFDLLAAQCRCDGEPLRERAPSDADYLVVYGRRIQLRRWGASLEQFLQAREPLHRIWINGIEMARIYGGPRLDTRVDG